MATPATRTPTATPAKKLTPTGYVSAVLRMRDAQRPREIKLLDRVPEPERAQAKALLAKLDGG